MNTDFWIALWSWLLSPIGEQTRSRHARMTLGPYRGRHRATRAAAALNAGEREWLARHRRDFAHAYTRVA